MDLSVVPEIRRAVEGAVASGCRHIVLDLAQVVYADSSALGLLVWMDRMLQPMGGKLILAGADRNVTRVLELSGLVGLAPSIMTAPDAKDAIEGLELPPESDEPMWEEAIVVAARVEEMSSARTRVCDLIAPLGMADASLFDVKVAVGEALANAVRHGSPDGESDQISLGVSAYPDRIVVTVADRGVGFDGLSHCDDDVYAVCGRGIMFMRALMDHVEFRPGDDGGTVVRLTKSLHSGSRQADEGEA